MCYINGRFTYFLTLLTAPKKPGLICRTWIISHTFAKDFKLVYRRLDTHRNVLIGADIGPYIKPERR